MYIYIHTHTLNPTLNPIYIFVYFCVCVCIYIYIYIHICMCVCVCVCVCVYTLNRCCRCPSGVSEQQRAESPVHAPLPARASTHSSVIVHASAEMDSEFSIAVGWAQAHLRKQLKCGPQSTRTSEHADSVD